MAEQYLLVVEEQNGEHIHHGHHTITAENRQMVKYHYHRTLKDSGYGDSQFGKHILRGPRGIIADIVEISPVSKEEHQILDEHLPTWPKI